MSAGDPSIACTTTGNRGGGDYTAAIAVDTVLSPTVAVAEMYDSYPTKNAGRGV
jgi:hypothetical protein